MMQKTVGGIKKGKKKTKSSPVQELMRQRLVTVCPENHGMREMAGHVFVIVMAACAPVSALRVKM
jgi:hypothetical protein